MPPRRYSPGPERRKTVALRVSLQLIVCPLNPRSQHNALTSHSVPQTPSPTRTGWGLRHNCSEAHWRRYEPAGVVRFRWAHVSLHQSFHCLYLVTLSGSFSRDLSHGRP